MPILQSAKQALRKDQRRTLFNIRRKRVAKKAIDLMKADPSSEHLSQAYAQIDKLVKNKLYHSNKGSRVKSQLSKLLNGNASSTEKPKTATKPRKKLRAKSSK